jgi:hypothetical protein
MKVIQRRMNVIAVAGELHEQQEQSLPNGTTQASLQMSQNAHLLPECVKGRRSPDGTEGTAHNKIWQQHRHAGKTEEPRRMLVEETQQELHAHTQVMHLTSTMNT